MLKKLLVTTCLSVLTPGFILFNCKLPEPPAGPDEARVTLFLKSSDGKIDRSGSIIDSVGKEIQIGIVLYLTQYIDSSVVRVIFDADTERVFPWAFKKNIVDTVFFPVTFTKTGTRSVEVTGYITDQPNSVAEGKIIIYGSPQVNRAPQWNTKNIQRTVKHGAQLMYDLSDNCSDTDNDKVTFSVISGPPANDTIIGTTYSFTPTPADTGKHIIHVLAKDVAGLTDTLTLEITVSANDTPDNLPPVITFLSPSKDTIISADSFEVKVTCIDDSGYSVQGYRDGTAFTLKKSVSVANLWTGMAKGIAAGSYSAIKIIAVDSSATKNKDSATVRIKYDNDKSGPTITLVTPSKDSVTINSSSYTVVLKVTDPSGVNSVNGASEEIIYTGVRDTGSIWKINITTLENHKVTAVILTATDGSLKTNQTLDTVYIRSDIVNGYKIKFDKNDSAATGTMADQTINSGDSAKLTANTFVKEGSQFAGWMTSPTGSIIAYADGVMYKMGTTDVILYARWSKKSTFALTINATNGSVIKTPNAVVYDSGSTVGLKATANTGYKFVNWSGDATGTTDSTTVVVNKVTAIAANFSPVSYTMTYRSQGTTYSTVTVIYNALATEPAAPQGGTCDSFGGWYTNETYATKWDFSADKVTCDTTLFAKWTTLTYTVSYNANGASTGSVPAQQIKTCDVALTLATNSGSLTKTGNIFSGWNTAPDGKGTDYAQGANYTANAPLELYAKWKTDSLMVTFNSNDGSTVPSKMVAYGGYVPEPGDPTKAGFAFAGWYSNQSLTTPFDFATAITVARTLYAKWDQVFTVTYNANDGNGAVPIDNNKYENGQVVTVLGAGSLSRTNYTFGGWNTQADTLGTNFGVTFQMGNANVTLYAKWRMNAPVITTQPTNKNCPVNDSVTFSVAASGAGLSYQWQKNNGDIAGATSASYTPPALTVADTAGSLTYRCVVSNAGGSISSNVATLSVSTLTDVDGNVYHQLKIGTQTWTMENFRATNYTNGTPVPKDPSAVTWENANTPKYCYY
ncbi:MAG TPA: InlB B-repeat-containing protein, partial [Chitinispirillaceae bacterium]|nr:InlB B-repeat-containing protein [Chitinispirillaceae bacterium]